jgi:hypothetical protein
MALVKHKVRLDPEGWAAKSVSFVMVPDIVPTCLELFSGPKWKLGLSPDLFKPNESHELIYVVS